LVFSSSRCHAHRHQPSFPTRRSSDLKPWQRPVARKMIWPLPPDPHEIIPMNTIHNAADLVGRLFLVVLYVTAGFGKIGAYSGTAAYMEAHGVAGFLLPLVILT